MPSYYLFAGPNRTLTFIVLKKESFSLLKRVILVDRHLEFHGVEKMSREATEDHVVIEVALQIVLTQMVDSQLHKK